MIAVYYLLFYTSNQYRVHDARKIFRQRQGAITTNGNFKNRLLDNVLLQRSLLYIALKILCLSYTIVKPGEVKFY